MKKYLLTLIVTMLTAIGAWAADGVVEISPTPTGTIELGLADQGKTFAISCSLIDEYAGNTQRSVVYLNDAGEEIDDPELISSELGVHYATEGNTFTWKIAPNTQGKTGTVRLKVIVKTPGYITGDAVKVYESAIITVAVTKPITASFSAPKILYMTDEGLSASLSDSNVDLSDAGIAVIYKSSNPDVVTVNSATGVLTPLKEGYSNISVSVKGDGYKEFVSHQVISVKKSKYALSGLTLTENSVVGTAGGSISVATVPTITFNGTEITEGGFTLRYSLEGATSGIQIDSETGSVTVPASTPAQQFAVVANVVPNDPAKSEAAVLKASVVVTSEASVTVSVDAAGVYTVNVPSPGAFGDINDTPAIVVPEGNAATLDGLKTAASVKVTGLINNADMAELIHLIGDAVTVNEGVCTVLDMGEAQMVGNIVSDNSSHSWISDPNTRTFKLTEITLPRPDYNYTVLPTGMYQLSDVNANGGKLTKIIIPDGWTEVGAHAFADGSGNGSKNLSELKLANTIKKIGEAAFRNLGVKTLYLPNQLESIDRLAFDVTENPGAIVEGSDKKVSPMQDVYFTGPAPRFVHAEAFATCSQAANSTCNDEPKNGQHMPEATRLDYSVAGTLACLMHYPKEYEDDYIDRTRVYTVVDTKTAEYQKGSTATYLPEGWTDAFLNTVKNSTHRTNDLGFLSYYNPYQNMVDGGFLDVTYGTDLIWPSHYQMTDGYIIANAGYRWDGTPLDPDTQYNPAATADNELVDRRGLYQFIVAVGNAPENQEEWKFKFEQNKWYTISLPFDMSPAEIRKVFGAETQVCRISKVTRDLSGDKKILKLEFRNSVMEEGDGRPEDIEYTLYVGDGLASMPQAGILHHHPYMIKPKGEVDLEDANVRKDADGNTWFKGYESIPGTLYDEVQMAVNQNGDNVTKDGNYYYYYFRPILMAGKIKKNSYILSNYNGKHQFVFYKGAKVKDAEGNYIKDAAGQYVYEDGGSLKANTAYVQLNQGEAELEDFFVSTDAAAKLANSSFFGDDESANEIDEVVILCGDDKAVDNKVYTIGGQLVSNKNLPAGLYIKNGKKFLVK